jgi:hypothetical protein
VSHFKPASQQQQQQQPHLELHLLAAVPAGTCVPAGHTVPTPHRAPPPTCTAAAVVDDGGDEPVLCCLAPHAVLAGPGGLEAQPRAKGHHLVQLGAALLAKGKTHEVQYQDLPQGGGGVGQGANGPQVRGQVLWIVCTNN